MVEVSAASEVIADLKAFGLPLRLLDRFGDNGVIAIFIGRLVTDDEAHIDTWLIRRRLVGARRVDAATWNLIVQEAPCLGV